MASTEAAISLSKAAQRFMKKHSQCKSTRDEHRIEHVTLGFHCEIDKQCQSVLRRTYPGQCLFDDITKMDMASKVGLCSCHGKLCQLQPKLNDTGRFLV